eukprot:8569980-Pyramimonas_sp.AAC.1
MRGGFRAMRGGFRAMRGGFRAMRGGSASPARSPAQSYMCHARRPPSHPPGGATRASRGGQEGVK